MWYVRSLILNLLLNLFPQRRFSFSNRNILSVEQQGRPERHGSLSETRQLRKQFDPETTPVKRSVRIVEDKNTQHR